MGVKQQKQGKMGKFVQTISTEEVVRYASSITSRHPQSLPIQYLGDTWPSAGGEDSSAARIRASRGRGGIEGRADAKQREEKTRRRANNLIVQLMDAPPTLYLLRTPHPPPPPNSLTASIKVCQHSETCTHVHTPEL